MNLVEAMPRLLFEYIHAHIHVHMHTQTHACQTHTHTHTHTNMHYTNKCGQQAATILPLG